MWPRSIRLFLAGLAAAQWGCSAAGQAPEPAAFRPPLLDSPDLDPLGGADAASPAGDHAVSPYFRHPDVFRLKSGGSRILLERYRPFLQTAEWSCGPAAVLTALTYLGFSGYDESSIARSMGTHADARAGGGPGTATEYGDLGTDVLRMVRFLRGVPGLRVVDSSLSDPDRGLASGPAWAPVDQGQTQPRFRASALYDGTFLAWLRGHLARGRPILAEWADWDGHWVVVIGHDDLGTPGVVADDVLFLADPYDTTDHWRDGYQVVPLERFWYQWHDRRYAPTPWRLMPFVVVDRVSGAP